MRQLLAGGVRHFLLPRRWVDAVDDAFCGECCASEARAPAASPARDEGRTGALLFAARRASGAAVWQPLRAFCGHKVQRPAPHLRIPAALETWLGDVFGGVAGRL